MYSAFGQQSLFSEDDPIYNPSNSFGNEASNMKMNAVVSKPKQTSLSIIGKDLSTSSTSDSFSNFSQHSFPDNKLGGSFDLQEGKIEYGSYSSLDHLAYKSSLRNLESPSTGLHSPPDESTLNRNDSFSSSYNSEDFFSPESLKSAMSTSFYKNLSCSANSRDTILSPKPNVKFSSSFAISPLAQSPYSETRGPWGNFNSAQLISKLKGSSSRDSAFENETSSTSNANGSDMDAEKEKDQQDSQNKRRGRRRSKKKTDVPALTSTPPKNSASSYANDNRLKYKTELCIHWMKNGECSFGDKCLFSHGEDSRKRIRCSKYRTETCSDPARASCGTCIYILRDQNRCNFAHPGEALRCDMGKDYYDEEYDAMIEHLYPGNEFPFGIYL